MTLTPARGPYDRAIARMINVPDKPGHVVRLVRHSSGNWCIGVFKVVGCELWLDHFTDGKPKKQAEQNETSRSVWQRLNERARSLCNLRADP